MIKQLVFKLFGLEYPEICQTCEVLRIQLDKSERERTELLHKLLAKDTPEQLTTPAEEPVAITPQFVPWRIRQQMLEAEDRKKHQLMQDKEKEISELEKELGVAHDVPRGESGGVKFDTSKVS